MSATRLAWAFLAMLLLNYLGDWLGGDWLGGEEGHFVLIETKVITREQYSPPK